jgi:putative tricarboxylic transport membrane protein
MNKECAASLIFFFAGIYGFIFSIHLPLGRWREPGPGVFPLSLSILLCLSGILWFIYGKKKGKEGKKEERIDWRGIAVRLLTPIKILGITLAFILSLEKLGYLLGSFLYMFILFLGVSRYRLWIAIGLALIAGIGSWYFFQKMLAIQLPQGLLPL